VQLCEFQAWRLIALEDAEQRTIVTAAQVAELHRDHGC
jgi:hypothetical protein